MYHINLPLYHIFYRELGVRRISELLSPRLNVFKGLPRDSVLHHLTHDDQMFPDAEKSYFHGYSKRIPLDIVYQTDKMEGHPRQVPFLPQRYILPFTKKHPIFRYIPNAVETSVDERTLVVVNYNPLKFVYRYIHTPTSDYQRWEGFQKTLWSHIGELAKKTNKHHFVIMEPFKELPSFSTLMNFSDKSDMIISRLFNTDDKRFILHLSTFIMDHLRPRSVFNTIPIESLKRVNIIFMLADGRCSVLNLSYLYSWIKGDQNVSDIKITLQMSQEMVVRSILKYFLVLTSSIPEDASEDLSDIEPSGNVEEYEPEDEDHIGPEPSYLKSKSKTEASSTTYPTTKLVNVNEVEEIPLDMAKKIEEDLDILEEQSRHDLSRRGIVIRNNEVVEVTPVSTTSTYEEVYQEVYQSYSPNEVLKNKIHKALEDGTLNSASYKKAMQDSDRYTEMPDPYGSGELVLKKTTIDPSALEISVENSTLVDHDVVLDKSMTKSTLEDYTRGYLNNHLRNDVLKAIGGLQKGGVIVQKHEITTEHSIMGSVEIHNLELKPINGVASSLWFKLPIVNDDGTYLASGNRYALRKQRVDLPIRKISPTEVALNSYYGKSFVSTESKVASSTSGWILKQIDLASFNESDWIKEVKPGDVSNSYRKTPYIYGMISTRFISFTAGPLKLIFNGSHPDKTYPAPITQRIMLGMSWCGTNGKDDVFVDMDNHFYLLVNNILTDLGDIYTVLRLSPLDSPVRFSELAIFRKNVPVGIILGYRLGWSKLLLLLKVKPRIVEPRKRMNLMPDEYPITFLDRTCIFSRKDQFATMILAGFMEYANITKTISLENFEHQDVYLNILSSKGLGAVYIREVDMLFDYFIDPITEDILLDMKEPTTFEGLLLRATEMLLTYQHPKNYDTDYTRIRGYERLPGMVYKEMTAAIRQFRSKNISGRSKIDISPYKVWQSLSEDPTKMMVPEINPFQDLKNDECITYVGEGGRSSEGINKASRSYHVSDIGVVSEGTIDNSGVGVNVYASADPNIKNYRGLKNHEAEVKSTNLHGSAVLLAPSAMHDDKEIIVYK